MHPSSAFRVTSILGLAIVGLAAACGEATPPDVTPASVAVTAVDTLRSIGASATLTAAVRNAAQQAIPGVTASSWESSDPAVLAVNSTTGLATAVANGTATVTARHGTLSGSTLVVVHQRVATVAVSGPVTIGSLGSTVQLTAAAADGGGTPISGRTVQWSSTNTAVATIDAASGIATAVGPGTTTLQATIDGTFGSLGLTVVQIPASIAFTAPTDTLRALGATAQYSAVVKDSGGAAIDGAVVNWTSSAPAVATVTSPQGLATAVTNGTAFMRAQAASVFDSVRLVVRQRVDASKSRITVARPLLFVDDTVRVTLVARDANDNQLAFGGHSVMFLAGGGSSAGMFRPTVDNGNGTYSGDFVGLGVGSQRPIGATIDGAGVAATPTLRVVGFTKVMVYSTGFSMSCGTLTTSDMYCWGEWTGGARGTGFLVEDPGPTVVKGGHQWTDFDVGAAGVCGLANAKLYCWGDAGQGSLGNGATSGRYPLPVPILPDSSFASLELGMVGGACAITTGQTAMCWAAGTWGRLGNGADTLAAVPVPVSGGYKFAAVTTSFSGSCGVTDAGAAMCWGYFQYLGMTGPFDTCTIDTPCKKTPVAAAGGITFKPIIFHGSNEVCAIATTDKTYCWGQWGDYTPAELFGAPVFTSLTTGNFDNCGLTQSGAVYCWGRNLNGRFGSPPNFDEIHRVPEPIASGHSFTQLSMGTNHMCGVKADGNAWCWGSNGKGELGDGTTTPSATPVRVRLFLP